MAVRAETQQDRGNTVTSSELDAARDDPVQPGTVITRDSAQRAHWLLSVRAEKLREKTSLSSGMNCPVHKRNFGETEAPERVRGGLGD